MDDRNEGPSRRDAGEARAQERQPRSPRGTYSVPPPTQKSRVTPLFTLKGVWFVLAGLLAYVLVTPLALFIADHIPLWVSAIVFAMILLRAAKMASR